MPLGVGRLDAILPLRLLRRGEVADIEEVVGLEHDVHRLRELGLRSGVAVEMLQPGSPCIVKVADHKYCFRDGDVFGIFVRPRVAG